MKKRFCIRIKRKSASKVANKEITPEREFAIQKQKLKKKRKRKQLKRRFYIIVIFLFLIGTLAVLFKAPFFNIREVICVGQERLTEKEILNTAKVKEGQNIFVANISDIKERVKAIPFVSESNARRIFPDKVKIWVRESVPVFAIKQDGKYVICDINTKVLEIVDKNENNLCLLTLSKKNKATPGTPYISKTDAQENKLLELITILEKLDMIKKANHIDFSDISDIMILYDSRLKIKIGNTNEMEYKLKFINKVITEKISEYEKATVDYTGDKLYVGQYEEKKIEKQPEPLEKAEDKEKTKSGENTKKENENEQKTS